MSLQMIKDVQGKDEYVLLPISVYEALRDQIEDELAGLEAKKAVVVAFGHIRIQTDPSVAEIFIDDAKMGVTPFTVQNVAAGKHNLNRPILIIN